MTTFTVHFEDDKTNTHLSGQIEADELPDYVWLQVDGLHPFWVQPGIWSGGSADGRYREYHGAEFPADSPSCTSVR